MGLLNQASYLGALQTQGPLVIRAIFRGVKHTPNES